MKKIFLGLGVIILAMGLLIGCSKKDTLFTNSGLDSVHITSLIVTNDVTKNTSKIIDADGVNKFLDELNSIEMPKDERQENDSGCNTPGKNKYYIELEDANGKVVGDVVISKVGDILLNNYESKKAYEVSDEAGANRIEEVLETNINP